MLDVLFWIFVFVASLFVLIKGADYLIENAELVGRYFRLSPFIIGVVIIGIGTSLPELVTSLVAVFEGVTEIVTANAVGSNIANILLVLGLTSILANNLSVKKNLIYLDLPILMASTIIFIGVVVGREMIETGQILFVINRGEAIFLITTYIIYLVYAFLYQDEHMAKIKAAITRPAINFKNWALLIAGMAGVVIGGKFTIDSTIMLSELLGIGVGVISLFAISLGTSLPELFVSYKAARAGKPELALGNIFGSNTFNMLILVGLPGLFTNLVVDEKVLYIGIPTLFAATLIFVISGISNKVHRWDGAMYVMIYILFIAKLFEIF